MCHHPDLRLGGGQRVFLLSRCVSPVQKHCRAVSNGCRVLLLKSCPVALQLLNTHRALFQMSLLALKIRSGLRQPLVPPYLTPLVDTQPGACLGQPTVRTLWMLTRTVLQTVLRRLLLRSRKLSPRVLQSGLCLRPCLFGLRRPRRPVLPFSLCLCQTLPQQVRPPSGPNASLDLGRTEGLELSLLRPAKPRMVTRAARGGAGERQACKGKALAQRGLFG